VSLKTSLKDAEAIGKTDDLYVPMVATVDSGKVLYSWQENEDEIKDDYKELTQPGEK